MSDLQPHIYPHDRILDVLILRFIPRSVHPNHVTALRFILTPVVLFFIITERYGIGIPLFLFTAATDAIDGALARTRNQITRRGIMLDPLADKLLIGSVLVVLAFRYVNIYVASAVVAMEVLIIVSALIYRWYRHRRGVPPANWWGKTKMILQVIAVFLVLLGLLIEYPFLIEVASFVFGGAVVFALMSLFTRSI